MLGHNPLSFGSPIRMMPPVYGSYTPKFGEYMSAGMIISIVHGMTMLIGSFTIVRERNDGHLERSFVAGVKPIEIILSHMVYLLLPVLSQVAWVISVSYFYFNIRIEGSLLEVFILTLLSALQGLIFGVGISVMCPSVMASLVGDIKEFILIEYLFKNFYPISPNQYQMIVFLIEMPLIFTSGTLYPLESLTMLMHRIMLWNPLTLPINSLRNIMLRGWTFGNFYVQIGLISSLSYSIVVSLFTFIFFQITNHS